MADLPAGLTLFCGLSAPMIEAASRIEVSLPWRGARPMMDSALPYLPGISTICIVIAATAVARPSYSSRTVQL